LDGPFVSMHYVRQETRPPDRPPHHGLPGRAGKGPSSTAQGHRFFQEFCTSRDRHPIFSARGESDATFLPSSISESSVSRHHWMGRRPQGFFRITRRAPVPSPAVRSSCRFCPSSPSASFFSYFATLDGSPIPALAGNDLFGATAPAHRSFWPGRPTPEHPRQRLPLAGPAFFPFGLPGGKSCRFERRRFSSPCWRNLASSFTGLPHSWVAVLLVAKELPPPSDNFIKLSILWGAVAPLLSCADLDLA